jgi:hypothetical protein
MPARCLLDCGWQTAEPVPHIAGCLATWHVYEKHRDAWIRLMGDREPVDPDPRDPVARAVLDAALGSS